MKLYALLDYETLVKKEWSIEQFIFTCKSLHVEIIQYRDKQGDTKRKRENLKLIKSLCDIPLVVNDTVDLVEFCDGIHLGQGDLLEISKDKNESVRRVREKIGDKIFGISTHNKQEILEANSLHVDYIGLGAYRATSTKDDATVLKESLSKLASLSFKPVGAIGGVRVNDEIENVTYAVVGSDIYEH
jgi:thiamine-phosphate pyrophosphorylase